MVVINNGMNKTIKQCRLCGRYARNWKNLFKATLKVYQDNQEKRYSLKPVPDVIKECLNFSVSVHIIVHVYGVEFRLKLQSTLSALSGYQ